MAATKTRKQAPKKVKAAKTTTEFEYEPPKDDAGRLADTRLELMALARLLQRSPDPSIVLIGREVDRIACGAYPGGVRRLQRNLSAWLRIGP
jgi:hypothetical protein